MKNQVPQPFQTLKNVSIFVAYEAVDKMISTAAPELVDSLIEKTATVIVAKQLKTRSTSSRPTVYGDFFYMVGENAYELIARYDEDRHEWLLVF